MQFVRLTTVASHTTKPKRHGTPEAPLLGELSAKQTERLYRAGLTVKLRLYTTSLSRLSLDTSPSRGGLGIAVQFVLLAAAAWHTTRTKHSGTPEAPLLGELSAKQTERLYGRHAFPLQAASAGLQFERLYRRHAFPLQAASAGLQFERLYGKPPTHKKTGQHRFRAAGWVRRRGMPRSVCINIWPGCWTGTS